MNLPKTKIRGLPRTAEVKTSVKYFYLDLGEVKTSATFFYLDPGEVMTSPRYTSPGSRCTSVSPRTSEDPVYKSKIDCDMRLLEWFNLQVL